MSTNLLDITYPFAIVEQVHIKFTGRIVLFIRCPFCGHLHYNDMGYIQKEYTYPVDYRDSRCIIALPYCPVILESVPPRLYSQYHCMAKEVVYDVLGVILKQRVKHVEDMSFFEKPV